MKTHLPILAAAACGHSSGIKDLVSDDEDAFQDGSGSGCFQIPADGICNCNTHLSCLQTCDDITCNQVLTACLGDDTSKGNCRNQSNSSDTPMNDLTLWITGGVLSVILVAAAVLMIALRKRKCCCKRNNKQAMESGPQIVLYQPNLQDPDHHYARIPINSVSNNIQEKGNVGFYSKVNEEIGPSMKSFSCPKYESQNIASENDYQTMPGIREKKEQKSDRGSVGLTRNKHLLEVKKEDKTIQFTNQSYQLMKDIVPSDNYEEMTGGQAPDNCDHYSHYQPMDGTDHYLAMSSPDCTTAAEDEYTVMDESNNGKYRKDVAHSILYGNEIGMQEVDAYANESVRRAKNSTEMTTDDEVYEKMSY
ncbi:uncharacterized protein LOC134267821 isoform X2 [Saccostrea cucullata]|uniref:uncharacterized protein LOC134267821 isoform X2 n=1 Tax=Saccostrea cuccullata TaxID=36930 RepID=UPI002ED46FBA